MLLFGSCNNIVLKWQDSQVIDSNRFDHPYLQVLFMFVGEYICLLVYRLLSYN
jgi:hypothetical protein